MISNGHCLFGRQKGVKRKLQNEVPMMMKMIFYGDEMVIFMLLMMEINNKFVNECLKLFLDALASPNTCPRQWVSE